MTLHLFVYRFPFAGITLIRFNGYDLSPNYWGTPNYGKGRP